MSRSARFLNPAEAARGLGVTVKALRLYEQRGLLAPARTAAGWRSYGPGEMARAREIAALRMLGLSLAQVARVLGGDAAGLDAALAAHKVALESERRRLAATIANVDTLRADLARGAAPAAEALARLAQPSRHEVAFALPWPWGGERFALRDIRALNYIVGPLGSGKTRLARAIAEASPDAAFLGLERSAAAARARLDADPALDARFERTLAWLVGEGATASDSLTALLAALESDEPVVLVVDMVEQGLDQGSQQALMAHLRRRGPAARPLFLLTRSCAILELSAVGADETIILCPANHSPPTQVAPYPGAAGYEAVATCLASPAVRERTAGVIAWRPQVA